MNQLMGIVRILVGSVRWVTFQHGVLLLVLEWFWNWHIGVIIEQKYTLSMAMDLHRPTLSVYGILKIL